MMTKNFKIIYNHGLCNETIVQANNEAEARKEGLAFYRKNSGGVNILSFFDEKFVVKSAIEIC